MTKSETASFLTETISEAKSSIEKQSMAMQKQCMV
jgi:hypothetical protein